MQSNLRALFAFALASVPAGAESAIDLNFGLNPSKSILGASYVLDKNRFNTGLMGFAFSSLRGYLISPGLSYNRYLTDNGFYANVSYAPVYRNEEVTSLRRTGPGSGDYAIETRREKGWEAGVLFLGGGKSFQFTRWGIHVDANLVTPAEEDFVREWSYAFGIGASYRFKLD